MLHHTLFRDIFLRLKSFDLYHSIQGTNFTPLIMLVNLFRISHSFTKSLRAMRPVRIQHSQHGCTMNLHSSMFATLITYFSTST